MWTQQPILSFIPGWAIGIPLIVLSIVVLASCVMLATDVGMDGEAEPEPEPEPSDNLRWLKSLGDDAAWSEWDDDLGDEPWSDPDFNQHGHEERPA